MAASGPLRCAAHLFHTADTRAHMRSNTSDTRSYAPTPSLAPCALVLQGSVHTRLSARTLYFDCSVIFRQDCKQPARWEGTHYIRQWPANTSKKVQIFCDNTKKTEGLTYLSSDSENPSLQPRLRNRNACVATSTCMNVSPPTMSQRFS